MKPNRWFGTIVLFTVLTMLIVYVAPGDSLFFILRFVFGFIFVAILPGYCLFSLLFAKENKLDLIEEAVLSVALSFGITGLTGLFLGLSPIGINFTSITVSLSTIVLILAALAFIRKSRLGQLNMQSSEQVSN